MQTISCLPTANYVISYRDVSSLPKCGRKAHRSAFTSSTQQVLTATLAHMLGGGGPNCLLGSMWIMLLPSSFSWLTCGPMQSCVALVSLLCAQGVHL